MAFESKYTDPELQSRVLGLHAKDFSLSMISRETGVAIDTVKKILFANGVDPTPKKIKSEKLIKNEERVLQLRREKKSYKEIADETGLGLSSVQKLCQEAGLNKIKATVKRGPQPLRRARVLEKQAESSTHWCAYHKQEEPNENFKVKENGLLDSWCRDARLEHTKANTKQRYAPTKAANEAKREYLRLHPPTERTCTHCRITKPIAEFLLRADRTGKPHSRCTECVREISRELQRANPEWSRQGARRRRAKMKDARSEFYKDEDIRERDNGLCYFCGEFIDPDLPFTDPMSQSINHIHPISKHGPDIAKNSTVAHSICNNKAKNRYSPVFLNWTVRRIESSLAREIAAEHHYLHRKQNVSFAYGVFDHSERLQGMVSFGSPSSNRILESVRSSELGLSCVVELNRLWVDDGAPWGLASWFVAQALKQLPPFIVISYSELDVTDPRYGTYHDGAIYRALSFNYAGQSLPRTEWRMPGSTRNSGKREGAELHTVSPKKRFWTVTGNRSDKKFLRSICKWPMLPYEVGEK